MWVCWFRSLRRLFVSCIRHVRRIRRLNSNRCLLSCLWINQLLDVRPTAMWCIHNRVIWYILLMVLCAFDALYLSSFALCNAILLTNILIVGFCDDTHWDRSLIIFMILRPSVSFRRLSLIWLRSALDVAFLICGLIISFWSLALPFPLLMVSVYWGSVSLPVRVLFVWKSAVWKAWVIWISFLRSVLKSTRVVLLCDVSYFLLFVIKIRICVNEFLWLSDRVVQVVSVHPDCTNSASIRPIAHTEFILRRRS